MGNTKIIKIVGKIYITLEEGETVESLKRLTLDEIASIADFTEWEITGI